MSTLRVNTIQDSSGGKATNTPGAARAWVRFNGTNGSIIASHNVSSVVRNSTGDYTITFTNPFADANYIMTGSTKATGSVGGYCAEHQSVSPTTSTFRLQVYYGYAANSFLDCNVVSVAFTAV